MPNIIIDWCESYTMIISIEINEYITRLNLPLWTVLICVGIVIRELPRVYFRSYWRTTRFLGSCWLAQTVTRLTEVRHRECCHLSFLVTDESWLYHLTLEATIRFHSVHSWIIQCFKKYITSLTLLPNIYIKDTVLLLKISFITMSQ